MNATNQTDPLQVEFPRFLTIGSIIGLISGFALGTVAHASPHAAFEWLGGVTGPVGAAWTHALMMVVIPLIVSFLIVATAGDGTRAAARLGALTLTLFIAFLVAAAALTVVLGVSLTKWMPTDPDALGLVVGSSTHQLGAASSEGARTGLGLGEWLVALFPSNPIRAAADGDILAVVVVSVLFGLAIFGPCPWLRSPWRLAWPPPAGSP